MTPRRVPLLFIVAMEAEAAPIVERLALEHGGELDPPLPFQTFEGQDIALVTPGRDPRHGVDSIGTQPAAVLADAAFRRYTPRLVINAGVAGGFAEQGAHVGEVLIASPHAVFHDRRIDLPGFREYGVGGHPCVDLSAPPYGPHQGFDVRTGVVSTGDALDARDEELAWMRERGVVAKDMEAASIAWVCALRRVPFGSTKCITDFVDRPADTTADFLENLHTACARLAEFVEALTPRALASLGADTGAE